MPVDDHNGANVALADLNIDLLHAEALKIGDDIQPRLSVHFLDITNGAAVRHLLSAVKDRFG